MTTDTDAYDLLTRRTTEVITDEELRELAADPEGKRAYVGYEPSGVLHLGHMLTANKLLDLQEAGMEVVVLLADVHAYLNGKGTFEEIRETGAQMREQFLAYGLDEDQTEFVYGSEFQTDEEYVLDLHELELSATLNRAQRAMAEIQGDETAKVSHVVYPLMQALDIEYLDLDLAIGGLDQRKVHVLHREEIEGSGYESRPRLHTPILAGLGTGAGKLSSSSGVTISMDDSAAAAALVVVGGGGGHEVAVADRPAPTAVGVEGGGVVEDAVRAVRRRAQPATECALFALPKRLAVEVGVVAGAVEQPVGAGLERRLDAHESERVAERVAEAVEFDLGPEPVDEDGVATLQFRLDRR